MNDFIVSWFDLVINSVNPSCTLNVFSLSKLCVWYAGKNRVGERVCFDGQILALTTSFF